MKKVLKWVGIAFVGLMVLGIIVNATKSPEQKAAEAAAQAQKQSNQVVEDNKRAESEREESLQKSVPKCDNAITTSSLKRAFDQSQFARDLNLSAIEISVLQEKGFNPNTKSRNCSGVC